MTAARFAITATVALALVHVAHAQGTGPAPAIPAALRAHVRGETFAPVTTVGALPDAIRGALKELFGGRGLQLAEPGAPFQATDVIVLPPLPSRRLILAGCSPDHCLVYYERGGFTHVYNVVLIRTDGTNARLEFGGQVPGGMKDLYQVRNVLVSGKVLVGSKYW